MGRPGHITQEPPWLEAFGEITGIDDRDELVRLHSLASLLRSSKPRPAVAARGPSRPAPATPPKAAGFDIGEAYAAQSEHMEMIACSLGACPECWGHDPDCTQCVGEGRPGAFLPDERCFERFVLPVIQRILREHKSPAPDPRGTTRTQRLTAEHRSEP